MNPSKDLVPFIPSAMYAVTVCTIYLAADVDTSLGRFPVSHGLSPESRAVKLHALTYAKEVSVIKLLLLLRLTNRIPYIFHPNFF
jgi:hypothetical protein